MILAWRLGNVSEPGRILDVAFSSFEFCMDDFKVESTSKVSETLFRDLRIVALSSTLALLIVLMRSLDYWKIGGDEIEVSDDESFDLEEYWSDKEETVKNFKIETVRIKSFLMLFGITTVLIDVNAAQSKLVLLKNFNENYSRCLRLMETELFLSLITLELCDFAFEVTTVSTKLLLLEEVTTTSGS
ncbi:hypothetical protein Tco_0537630 [Tanacetum coccineum]